MHQRLQQCLTEPRSLTSCTIDAHDAHADVVHAVQGRAARMYCSVITHDFWVFFKPLAGGLYSTLPDTHRHAAAPGSACRPRCSHGSARWRGPARSHARCTAWCSSAAVVNMRTGCAVCSACVYAFWSWCWCSRLDSTASACSCARPSLGRPHRRSCTRPSPPGKEDSVA